MQEKKRGILRHPENTPNYAHTLTGKISSTRSASPQDHVTNKTTVHWVLAQDTATWYQLSFRYLLTVL